jgi:hypothetical protein
LALLLFPVVMVTVAIAWIKLGGGDISGMIASAAIALLVSVLIFWKGLGVVVKGLHHLRSTLPEPLYSGLTFGLTGALAVGGLMTTVILLLGHTRPIGWDFDRIPIWMAIAFLVCLGSGLSSGAERKRKSRVQSESQADHLR